MYFCNVLEEFKQHIDTNFQILKDKTFLLACSGGLDSVVLTHLCHAIGLNFTLAHCNFQLRGIESSEDQKFVEKLAENKNVGIHVTIFKTVDYMNLNKVSLQVAARELRYAWFAKIMQENSIPTLVTAHHADDNLETFLINLSRGTGLDGLTGIPEKTDTIARPLFPFTREQIKAYAKKNAIVWREDKSNQETKYLRNKIRHTIVPLLKELHPTFLGNFLNTQAYLGQTAELVENHISEVRASLFIKENNIYKIEIAALQKLHPQTTYVYHLFKPYGFSDARSIMALCEALSGKEILSASYRLLKDREHLLLQEVVSEVSEVFFIHKKTKNTHNPIAIRIESTTHISETGTAILYVDTDTLKFPLTVRKWKTGDYFHPFGMKGVKKLSKFYKDEKYSLIAKETQWLLCSEDQIVWVIGKRADSRFKVSGKTKNILKFTVQNE
tara:strand:- start:86686 stop:88011 length:1326 start_codon:yes stop_codon:yes gene_type:complete